MNTWKNPARIWRFVCISAINEFSTQFVIEGEGYREPDNSHAGSIHNAHDKQMSSMTQQVKPIDSNPDYEHNFIHVLDEHPLKNHADAPFGDAINSAFARLQDIIAAKISVEAELDDLFTKRRAHALEELEKARRRLEFVDQEEKKMRNKIKGSSFGQPDVWNLKFRRNSH